MNAFERVVDSESQILYKKVEENFVQCNDPWALSGLRDGWHLVKVSPGVTTIRACVNPAKTEFQARAYDMEEKLIDIIRDASTAKPRNGQAISNEALKDWDAFISKHGDEFNSLSYPSFAENAEKIIKVLTSNE